MKTGIPAAIGETCSYLCSTIVVADEPQRVLATRIIVDELLIFVAILDVERIARLRSFAELRVSFGGATIGVTWVGASVP
jgi:hypothetical protein